MNEGLPTEHATNEREFPDNYPYTPDGVNCEYCGKPYSDGGNEFHATRAHAIAAMSQRVTGADARAILYMLADTGLV